MKAAHASLAGGAVWVALVCLTVRSPFEAAWMHAMLLFAALVLLPLVLDLAGDDAVSWSTRALQACAWGQLPAALLLLAAYGLAPGWFAAWCAMPWLGITALIALAGFVRLVRRRPQSLDAACVDVGLVYLVIGGVWTLAGRLGLHPLGFDPVVVELTAVHFHYAGLILPVVTGLVIQRLPDSIAARVAGWGVITGVPLVALGITATQLRFGQFIETSAGWWLALAGVLVAGLHLRLAPRRGDLPLVRGLWLIAGGSLLWTMLLAAGYALRSYPSWLPALDISAMRALHGTANALGFGFAGVFGWWLAQRGSRSHSGRTSDAA